MSQLQFDEAEAILQDAVSHSAYAREITRADLALCQIISGKLDDAENTLTSIQHDVDGRLSSSLFPIGISHAALLHAARGNFAKAAQALAVRHPSGVTLREGLQVLFWGLAGNRKKARKCYASMKSWRQVQDCALALGLAASGAGYGDEAVKWLTRAALEERDPFMILIAVLPTTRHLRQHAGFRSLVLDTMKLRFPSEQH
jgi:hypothetical protein